MPLQHNAYLNKMVVLKITNASFLVDEKTLIKFHLWNEMHVCSRGDFSLGCLAYQLRKFVLNISTSIVNNIEACTFFEKLHLFLFLYFACLSRNFILQLYTLNTDFNFDILTLSFKTPPRSSYRTIRSIF